MDFQLPKWAARHAVVAPWGILATTYVLTALTQRPVVWTIWNDLNAMSAMVDLGLVVYAAEASLIERGVRMAFYAIEQRQKQREKIRKEAREQGLREGLEEGRQKGLQEGIQEGRQKGRQEGIQEGRQKGLQEGRQEALREFAHSIVLKSSQNPGASIEDLVETVTSEMGRVKKDE